MFQFTASLTKKKFPLASGFQINFNDFLKICGQLFACNACKTYFYEKTSAVNLGNVWSWAVFIQKVTPSMVWVLNLGVAKKKILCQKATLNYYLF